VLVVLAALAFAACSGDDDASEDAAGTPPGGDGDTPTATSSPTASPAATGSATATATPPAATGTTTATPDGTTTAAPTACTMFEQNSPPATYFGLLTPGEVVRAVNRTCGLDCGEFTTNAAGEWLIVVDRSSACLPRPGHTIEFYVNGTFTGHTESWEPGGAP
jgi:hypothetical protein